MGKTKNNTATAKATPVKTTTAKNKKTQEEERKEEEERQNLLSFEKIENVRRTCDGSSRQVLYLWRYKDEMDDDDIESLQGLVDETQAHLEYLVGWVTSNKAVFEDYVIWHEVGRRFCGKNGSYGALIADFWGRKLVPPMRLLVAILQYVGSFMQGIHTKTHIWKFFYVWLRKHMEERYFSNGNYACQEVIERMGILYGVEEINFDALPYNYCNTYEGTDYERVAWSYGV